MKPTSTAKYLISFLLVLFLGIHLGSSAQSKFLDKVNTLIDKGQYRNAIPLLEKQIIKDNKPVYNLRLAQCYQKIGNTDKAMENYETFMQSESLESKDAESYTALLILSGKPQVAKAYVEQYNLSSREISNQLLWIQKIEEELKKPAQFKVTGISINSEYSEASPMIYKKGMVLSADYNAAKSGSRYMDLYYTTLGSSPTQFKTPEMLKGNINSLYNDGAVTFERDRKMFFTRNSVFKGQKNLTKQGVLKLDIFGAELEDKVWTVNNDFPWNNKDYSTGHPTWSSREKRLYFVSDKPGGIGGTDIYYSDWNGKQWSEPKNMGDAVNTNQDEMFPYIAPDGTMFYSSKGRNTFGGLDFFMIKRDGNTGKWQDEAEHLGKEINSSGDDFGITFNKNMKSGYFTSNREGGKGADDIYFFQVDTMVKPTEAAPEEKKDEVAVEDNWLQLPVRVFDEETLKPLANADILLINTTTGERIETKSDSVGISSARLNKNETYKMTVQKSGYLTKSYDNIIPERSTKEVGLLQLTMNKVFTIRNIYYEYDKYELKEESKSIIQPIVQLMKDNTQIKIEISAHTDSRGSDSYNITLSQKRAKSVADYIVAQGIDAGRLSSLGYGEYRLLNKCKNEVPCSDAEHELNRRTEFKIVGITKREINYQR